MSSNNLPNTPAGGSSALSANGALSLDHPFWTSNRPTAMPNRHRSEVPFRPGPQHQRESFLSVPPDPLGKDINESASFSRHDINNTCHNLFSRNGTHGNNAAGVIPVVRDGASWLISPVSSSRNQHSAGSAPPLAPELPGARNLSSNGGRGDDGNDVDTDNSDDDFDDDLDANVTIDDLLTKLDNLRDPAQYLEMWLTTRDERTRLKVLHRLIKEAGGKDFQDQQRFFGRRCASVEACILFAKSHGLMQRLEHNKVIGHRITEWAIHIDNWKSRAGQNLATLRSQAGWEDFPESMPLSMRVCKGKSNKASFGKDICGMMIPLAKYCTLDQAVDIWRNLMGGPGHEKRLTAKHIEGSIKEAKKLHRTKRPRATTLTTGPSSRRRRTDVENDMEDEEDGALNLAAGFVFVLKRLPQLYSDHFTFSNMAPGLYHSAYLLRPSVEDPLALLIKRDQQGHYLDVPHTVSRAEKAVSKCEQSRGEASSSATSDANPAVAYIAAFEQLFHLVGTDLLAIQKLRRAQRLVQSELGRLAQPDSSESADGERRRDSVTDERGNMQPQLELAREQTISLRTEEMKLRERLQMVGLVSAAKKLLELSVNMVGAVDHE